MSFIQDVTNSVYSIRYKWICKMNIHENHNSIDYIESTLAIEGLTPSPEAIALCRKLSDGEVSPEEAENAPKSDALASAGRIMDLYDSSFRELAK